MSYVQRYYKHVLVDDVIEMDLDTAIDVHRMPPEMIEFCREVSKKLRGVKFAAYNCNSAYVYYPQDKYVMGRVGYGWIMKTNDEPRYYVYSRLIRNEKYDYNDSHFFTRIRGNLKTAVQCASATLRSYSDADQLNATFPKLVSALDDQKNTVEQEASTHRRKVLGDYAKLRQELKAAIDYGYQFNDPEFQEAVLAWSNCHSISTRLKNNKLAMYFVDASKSGLFNVQHIADSSGIQVDLYKQQPHQSYTEETLPEYIAGKLAVLSMMEPKHFIEGVGMRLDGGMFYVVAE